MADTDFEYRDAQKTSYRSCSSRVVVNSFIEM